MSATPEPAPPTRREIEAKIARRAWQDDAFRAEFLADPAAAFVRHTGIAAADLPRIVVHEEQPGSWHIVLPARPATGGELTDAELERIAGGTDVLIVATVASVSAAAVSVASLVSAGTAVSAYVTAKSGW